MKRCTKENCKGWCRTCLWLTISFPLEHVIWQKIPLLKLVPPMLGI